VAGGQWDFRIPTWISVVEDIREIEGRGVQSGGCSFLIIVVDRSGWGLWWWSSWGVSVLPPDAVPEYICHACQMHYAGRDGIIV
jgi:hypothetical protein